MRKLFNLNQPDPKWAWDAYAPSAKQPWDLRKAGHLYRRAAFGGNWKELERAVAQGPEKSIDLLLKGGAGQEAFEKQVTELAPSVVAGGVEAQLRSWWLWRMVYSPHPLREKLTLFWHNHFATSNSKVNNLRYMLGQNELMRRHALGSFRAMLHEMSKDPAMMIWLDTNQSKKGMPNENYARELMELFSLGRGNYSEFDIREAAKAFTGWEIKDAKFFFNAGQHDTTEKKVFGKSAKHKGEDIVNLCLTHKAAPYFITGKLYRCFISEAEPPSRELLEPLAEKLRQSDYDIAGVVGTMLRSNLFFSDSAYRSRVKSPTDFAVGIVHALEPEVEVKRNDYPVHGRIGTQDLAVALENLGQKLFNPPSVKGWDGGETWLNGTTLLQRQNLALGLCSTENNAFRMLDPAELLKHYGKKSDQEIVGFFVDLFLQGDLPGESKSRLQEYARASHSFPPPLYWTKEMAEEHRVRAICHLVLTQPEYQLD